MSTQSEKLRAKNPQQHQSPFSIAHFNRLRELQHDVNQILWHNTTKEERRQLKFADMPEEAKRLFNEKRSLDGAYAKAYQHYHRLCDAIGIKKAERVYDGTKKVCRRCRKQKDIGDFAPEQVKFRLFARDDICRKCK